ncbi:Ubiquinone biosynthesis O-methyltransferase [termite gut metagenome]|uniref:Ubiquinone biosynthesis O-methyltransferase n=1 Tax=termite gut metagenome TaxID=433724 RepID=A0A5J4SSH9_9ZZZZ
MNIKICPVCGNILDVDGLKVKDYSVSGEVFEICTCRHCTFSFTQPQPEPSAIGKYYQTEDYISHSDTKQGMVNRMYHLVRKKNTNDKLDLINRLAKKPASLLDVGCGTGYFLSACRQKAWQTEGVEVSDVARKMAEQRTGQAIYPSLDALTATGKQFDVITLWHVFEHLHDINASFLQLSQLLQPQGTLIFALPNLCCADALHYREFWAAYDVPRHLSHFNPSSLRRLVEKHGMKIEQILPMKMDAYYISMLSEKLKNAAFWGLMKAVWYGWQSNCRAKKDGNYSSLIYIIKK